LTGQTASQMSEQLSDLQRRNRIMTAILWGCLALAFVTAIDTPVMLRQILVFGLPVSLACTFLTWKKIGIIYVQYIIAFGLSLVSFFFLKEAVLVSELLILFLSVVIISIYPDYRPLVLNGVLSLAILNYYLLTKEAYAGEDVVGINTFMILVLASLLAQSRISAGMLKRIAISAEQSEQARRRTEAILRKVAESVDVLGQSAAAIHKDVSFAGTISKEVVRAYQEISVGIGEQATSLQEISHSMQQVTQTAEQTVASSEEMSRASQNISEITQQGLDNMVKLSEDIRGVNRSVEHAAAVMEEVNRENAKIGDIVALISEIADRTNLLSLNASIEAARAGEHGQGFSVVALEIRKLAASAQEASRQIAESLGVIQRRVAEASDMVHAGFRSAEEGTRAAEEAETLFERIRAMTADVLRQAEGLRERNEQMLAAAGQVTEETGKTAAISQQSAASVEEVLAGAEEQLQRMDSIVDSISRLNGLAVKLEALVKG